MKAQFIVHARLTSKCSLLVKNHLDHARKDLPIMCMPRIIGVAPEAFGVYVNWLYTGKLCCVEEATEDGEGGVSINNPISSLAEDPEYQVLSQLYKLGIRLKDEAFQISVLDAFFAKVEAPLSSKKYARLPGNQTIDTFFDHCRSGEEGRAGREMLIKVWVKYAGPLEHLGIRNRRFLDAVLGVLMSMRCVEG